MDVLRNKRSWGFVKTHSQKARPPLLPGTYHHPPPCSLATINFYIGQNSYNELISWLADYWTNQKTKMVKWVQKLGWRSSILIDCDAVHCVFIIKKKMLPSAELMCCVEHHMKRKLIFQVHLLGSPCQR